ncbi:hypothetical protein BDZ97DRAFT_1765590 [Flammula alnicola]|nr:hypothetical protein BDZ97DRAFT_1765590 [Flammula alnicola]
MTFSSDDHFVLICDLVKPTACIFSAQNASSKPPSPEDVLKAIETIHSCLNCHLKAAHTLPQHPLIWSHWLLKNTEENFHIDNQFLLSTCIPTCYEYNGVPVELSDKEQNAGDKDAEGEEIDKLVGTESDKDVLLAALALKCQHVKHSLPLSQLKASVPPVSVHSQPKKPVSSVFASMPPPLVLVKPIKPSSKVTASVRTSSPMIKVKKDVRAASTSIKAPVTLSQIVPSTPTEDDDSNLEIIEVAPVLKCKKGKAKASKSSKELLPHETIAIDKLSNPGPSTKGTLGHSAVYFTLVSSLSACCTFELHPDKFNKVLEEVSPFTSLTLDCYLDLPVHPEFNVTPPAC